MMKLRIFKNEYDYRDAVRNDDFINCYKATVTAYEYTMNETKTSPFSFIDIMGEKHSIRPVDIAMVGCSNNTITVILNIDPAASLYAAWADIIVIS